ncbi:MAG: type II secretion system protein [bacterium]|nr:type II secretion system protein [bacterium]
MNERGFSLLEALVAMALLGIVMAGVAPSFLVYLNINTHNEERSAAVQAATLKMEDLRRANPASMPSSGSDAMELITVGERDFEIVSSYCTRPTFCGNDTRHVAVEVSYGDKIVFTVESVFTQLR